MDDDREALEKLKADEQEAERRYISAADALDAAQADLDFARTALRKATNDHFFNLGWKWKREP